MSIEKEIFKRARFDHEKLLKYGFKKSENNFLYSHNIIDDDFRVDITIDDKNILSGKIIELDIREEYTNFRIENQVGEFVNRVREEYIDLLKDILDKCCEQNYFVTSQANRIAKMVIDRYGDQPEFLWKDLSSGVFRNAKNKKWYGIIMNIDRSKITDGTGEIELLNVKLDEEKIKELLKIKGYYTCYHMNKKKWISIILDDTLKDQEIMNHIIESHCYTEKSREWIIPANPKYYDVIKAFTQNEIINWKQSSNVQVGDYIYIYVAAPYSAILYKCQAIEVNLPYDYKDDNLKIKKIMKLKLLKKYDPKKYTFDKIIKYGIKSIRGPIYMPKELSVKINEHD